MSVRHGEKTFLLVGSIIRWTREPCQRVVAKISVKTPQGWENCAVERGRKSAKTSVKAPREREHYGGYGGCKDFGEGEAGVEELRRFGREEWES